MGFRGSSDDTSGNKKHRGLRTHTGINRHTGLSRHTGTAIHSGSYHVTGTVYASGSSEVHGGRRAAMMATGSIMTSGSIRGHELYYIHAASDLGQSAARYLPMGYSLGEAASAGYTMRFICPARGRVIRTMMRCEGAAGSSVLTLYKAIDGTAAPATSLEAITVDIDTADTTFDFNFTSPLHFAKGDVISFKLNPTNNPETSNWTHVLEFYTYNDIATGSV